MKKNIKNNNLEIHYCDECGYTPNSKIVTGAVSYSTHIFECTEDVYNCTLENINEFEVSDTESVECFECGQYFYIYALNISEKLLEEINRYCEENKCRVFFKHNGETVSGYNVEKEIDVIPFTINKEYDYLQVCKDDKNVISVYNSSQDKALDLTLSNLFALEEEKKIMYIKHDCDCDNYIVIENFECKIL